MKTQHIIFLLQDAPSWFRAALVAAKLRLSRKQERLALIEDIDHFTTALPKSKRALVVLSPDAWLVAAHQHPHITLFNYFGLIYVIVQSLNENGYIVDIADLTIPFQASGKVYDLFVGHGGNCKSAIDSLPHDTPVFQYVSGAHWKAFEVESRERYTRYASSRGIPTPRLFGRDMSEIAEGEEYLLNHADCLFSIGCPRMMASFGVHADKFFITGLGAYLDPKLDVPHEKRDFDNGRNHFIYVGGTSGNIQKGLDLLIESFAKLPNLHLYIYCKVEREILDYYSAELNSPNIHYIYHYRWPIFSKRLSTLLQRINFTIHAPINTGLGTAFSASLAAGLIPVGYVDYDFGDDLSVLSDQWDVDSLAETIIHASEKSPGWCEDASRRARSFHQANFSDDAVREKFIELFSESHLSKVRADLPS